MNTSAHRDRKAVSVLIATRPPACARRPRRAAFTLIELLTVIAIIGILAAILIPTVGKVRETAKAAACTSNQRQIVSALHLHAADKRDYLPPAALDNPVSRWTREPDFIRYLPTARRGEANNVWEHVLLVCPMATSPDGKSGPDLRVTYAASGALIGGDNVTRLGLDKDKPRKLGSIVNPARSILTFDGRLNVPSAAPVGTNYSYTWSQMSGDVGRAASSTTVVSFLHNNRFIAGMADGSVKTFSQPDFSTMTELRWRGLE